MPRSRAAVHVSRPVEEDAAADRLSPGNTPNQRFVEMMTAAPCCRRRRNRGLRRRHALTLSSLRIAEWGSRSFEPARTTTIRKTWEIHLGGPCCRDRDAHATRRLTQARWLPFERPGGNSNHCRDHGGDFHRENCSVRIRRDGVEILRGRIKERRAASRRRDNHLQRLRQSGTGLAARARARDPSRPRNRS